MNKLSDCILNKNLSRIPVWFMRQAGRYLPEFMEIRKKNQNFIKLCLNPDLVQEITLQPVKRFNLDATIIFSDILMVPYGLGQAVDFKKGFGPMLGDLNLENIINVEPNDFIKKCRPVYKSIQQVKENTKEESLIGFVGAPWTLLVYMMNKQSPKKNFNFKQITKNKKNLNKLLKKIENIICLHADKQIEAGANVIQIFDSWAGLLPHDEIKEYCFEPIKKIVDHIKVSGVPVICFPRGIGKNYENFCSYVKPSCISIDSDTDPRWIKERANGIPIQGGMDPRILLTDKDDVTKTVKKYLDIFSDYPYIFNLGHGVLPETKPEIIAHVVDTIKNRA